MNEQQRAEAAYLELVYGDESAARDIAREPIDPPTGCDMPCVCESVEYADAPVILTGPGGDYLHAETPDIAPMGWPMAVALACGVGVSIYAMLAFCWWLVTA